MSHGSLINHNPALPPSQGPSATISPSNGSTSANTSPAAVWQSFRNYWCTVRGTSVTAFEDPAAKALSRERRQARLWIQSSEKNSAVFDLQSTTVTPSAFFAALSAQYPDAIGAVPVQQGSVSGTVIAFDSLEARTRACSIRIKVDSFTIIGTPTLDANSTVYRLSLDKLPLCHVLTCQ
jgi:hypothetical protein